ncbi:hypothetical protein WMY93_006438 [Mugilogobius chulae]|uniref:Ig-like domain-containing protein n=1 Tax=Mugilogobius chulae TaxID=88201 RepID=A0AAW0PR88_9GOBI
MAVSDSEANGGTCVSSVCDLWVSGSVVDVMLKPGDNTTLHCDCKCPVGVYTVWYRNCSHPNQPTLVLRTKQEKGYKKDKRNLMNPLPGYQFVKNVKSKCYDLRITNITENDVGSYYCGTETTKVLDENETALTLLCILLLLIVIYTELCKQDVKEADTRVQMSQIENEDVCYAALEIRQASQRPKRKKKTTDSDFCTYSAIKTSQ